MANIRIKDQTTDTALVAGDYVIVDNETEGTRKFDLGQKLVDIDDDITDVKADLSELSSIPTNVRKAMLTLFESAAYAETGLTDEIAVVESWSEEVTAITLNQISISISGSGTVQLVATTVPSGKTVTWSSSDDTIATVSSAGLVTGVSNGSVTITAACGDKRATCTATVSGFASLVSISAVYTQTSAVYATTDLDDLKEDLVVTGLYDDSSTTTITNYTLSGNLVEGTSVITVSFSGKTTTFNVTVSPPAPLYTLYQGSGTASAGNTLTISNGNHISLNTTNNSRTFHTNETQIGAAIPSATFFSLAEGDEVIFKIKNIVFTSNTDAGNKFDVSLRNSNNSYVSFSGDITYSSLSPGTLEDVTTTRTISSNNDIKTVSFFVYRPCVVEFDVEIYVNGVRYI